MPENKRNAPRSSTRRLGFLVSFQEPLWHSMLLLSRIGVDIFGCSPPLIATIKASEAVQDVTTSSAPPTMTSFSGFTLVLSAFVLAVTADTLLPNQFHGTPLAHRQARRIEIVHHTDRRDDRGQFASQSVDSLGTHITEQGRLVKTADGLDHVLVKKGAYGYTSPEGVPVLVSWTADETGFHPEGDSLPLGPAEVRRHRH
ncbi:hypothetical protein GE061_017145 [Apolygus lucorum]|uniref:Uncharacterized protein n=1 Tax=Apolygus lucorum TaxID=248454 RepID=A0A6A4JVH4_APOLU|nr:hypothetical protein GE061_017145 [Apolygus lucorum]